MRGLSLAEKIELLELLEEKARRTAENRLPLYKPYAKQAAFHAAGATFRERLFRAGNQCLSPWSWVEMEHSTALSAIAFASTGARVRSWSGESECAVPLQNGFLRGIEPTFRLVLADGRFFDCPPNHQVLHESGWLSADQIMSLSGGVRFWETREGYQASCVEHGYLCDPQLPLDLDSDPSRLLQLADAQERTLSFSLEDAEARTRRCTNTYRASDRLSMRCDGLNRLADLCAKFAGPAVSKSVLPLRDAHRDRLRLVAGLGAQLRSSGGLPRHGEVLLDPFQTAGLSPSASCTLGPSPSIGQGDQQSLDAVGPGHSTQALDHDDRRLAIFVTFEPIRLAGGSEIVAIIPIGFQPVLDVQVPNTHNYKAAGVYHHNCGKTWSSSYEVAMHVTGRYPDWWPGRKWSRPVVGWAIGESMESTRDTMQRLILGRPGEWGTGTIPKDAIISIKRAQGISDSVDCVLVRHESGGISHLYFKSYEKGRSKLQGETLDFAALDEEPPLDIYTEVLTRTNATKGMVWITFTPLLGMSEVVRMFLQNPTPDRSDTNMTIDDVEHYTPEERHRIIIGYPEHEREARAQGIPILGSGRIFPIAESTITVQPFDIPDHWPRICGIDFGIDHPSAGVWLAWDRDADVVYVYDYYRASNETPLQIVPRIKQRGDWVPVAWPADGLQRSKGDGVQLADQYRSHGANMLHEHAQLPETGDEKGITSSRVSVEAGLMEMYEAMKQGKFKVFAGLSEWFDEFRLYHRKNGQVVKLQDDVMCFHPDTKVLTDAGPKAIKDLVGTTGKVVTIGGDVAEYMNCRLTRRDADVVRVTYSDGSQVLCTPDHKFLTSDGRWVFARDSVGIDCHNAVSDRSTKWTKFTLKGSGIPALEITTEAPGNSSTGLYGSLQMGLFQKDTISTTRTGTETTTSWKTSSLSTDANTYPGTIQGIPADQRLLSQHKPSGEKLKRGRLLCEIKGLETITSCVKMASLYVNAAASNLLRELMASINFAPRLVKLKTAGIAERTESLGFAPLAKENSSLIDSSHLRRVQEPVGARCGSPPQKGGDILRILRVENAGRSDVYCMEVPGFDAFALANGAVVHNCATRYGYVMRRYAITPPNPGQSYMDPRRAHNWRV